jgi:hypothetical protein
MPLSLSRPSLLREREGTHSFIPSLCGSQGPSTPPRPLLWRLAVRLRQRQCTLLLFKTPFSKFFLRLLFSCTNTDSCNQNCQLLIKYFMKRSIILTFVQFSFTHLSILNFAKSFSNFLRYLKLSMFFGRTSKFNTNISKISPQYSIPIESFQWKLRDTKL